MVCDFLEDEGTLFATLAGYSRQKKTKWSKKYALDEKPKEEGKKFQNKVLIATFCFALFLFLFLLSFFVCLFVFCKSFFPLRGMLTDLVLTNLPPPSPCDCTLLQVWGCLRFRLHWPVYRFALLLFSIGWKKIRCTIFFFNKYPTQ